MKTVRIIPRLDIKGPNLVKGIHLEGLRVLGSPEAFAQYYYENGADEIIFQDVVASLFERNSLHDIISKTAKNIFIPITVGGGLRTLDDIYKVLRAGADKVSLNTAAVKNPKFVEQAAKTFGSSTIVVAIEAIKNTNGKYYAFVDNGREETGFEVTEWAKKVTDLGAGEILITSVDRDGTGEGFDHNLISSIKSHVDVPVIAHGGGNKSENFIKTFVKSRVDAMAFASFLHYSAYNFVQRKPNLKEHGNRSFLEQNQIFKKINSGSIQDLKKQLINNQISCRN
jgi:cyclase